MKRIISGILALTVSMSATASVFAKTFNDLSDKQWEWAKSYVEEMSDMGLIAGYEDGTFRPGNSITHQEGLALFARAMGSANDSNDEVVALALEKYGYLLETYNIYAKEEVAFLLYRGALKITELDKYLKGTLKDEPMKRHEAAVIITKALGKENEAKNSVLTDLEYKDALDIPLESINYVYKVTQEGIMQGMGDGTFSPNTDVLRSQMAVMLYRTVDKIGLSIEKGKLISIDTNIKNITVKDAEGFQYLVGYSDSVIMKVEGEPAKADDVPGGVDAVFTYSGDSLQYVDTLTAVPDETITAIYAGYSNSGSELKISVYPQNTEDTSLVTYTCASNVAMFYDDSPATIKSYTKEDKLEVELSRGLVTKISGGPKETTITNATVESVEIDPEFKLTISHALKEYDGKSFLIGENVTVRKNGDPSTFRSIYTGDKVNLTMEYGIITKVVASSNTKKVEGTIAEVTTSVQGSSIKVKVNGEYEVYEVPKTAQITVNDQDGTLYDLHIGDTVKLTIESQAVTKIATTASSATAKQVLGVIDLVNSSRGIINVKITNSDGSVDNEMIFADEDVVVLDVNGNKLSFKKLTAGQTVSVVCSLKNGVYEASTVIVMAGAAQ